MKDNEHTNFENEYPTKHLTREYISQSFEKEKILRNLQGLAHDRFVFEFINELSLYIDLYNDNSPYEVNGKFGIRNNVLGTTMLSPIYDEIWDMSQIEIVGTPPFYHYCKVRIGDKYGFAATTATGGTEICPVVYDDILTFDDYSHDYSHINGIVIRQNNKYGFATANNILFAPKYDKITHLGNYCFLLEVCGKYGLYYNGHLIEAEYDDIKIPHTIGWIKAKKENFWGYFDIDYHFTFDASNAFLIRENIPSEINHSDKTILKSFFEEYSTLLEHRIFSQSLHRFTQPLHQRDINIDDTCYIACDEFDEDSSEGFSNKAYFFAGCDGIGLRHLFTGFDLIPPIYEELYRNNPYCYVYKRNGKYGFIDRNGIELSQPLYDEIDDVDESFTGMLVRQGDKWGIIRWGDMSFPNEVDYDEILPDHNHCDNITGFILKRGNKVGYHLHLPAITIPPIYDGIFVPKIFGWIRVCKSGIWGYLDNRHEFTSDESKAYLCFINSWNL